MEAYLGISTDKLLTAGAETIYMVCISLFIGAIIAFPLAILLYLTRKNGMYQNRFVNGLLNIIINVIRSTPFIIMLVCVMPLTKVLVGTRIGTKAALVPLTIYIAPYLARLMEGALLETKAGIIEAAEAMGATPLQIVWLSLTGTLGSLILTITTGTIGLIGATAMAGYIAGGGIGNIALTYGYQQFNNRLMFSPYCSIIIVVQLIQKLGNWAIRKDQTGTIAEKE